MSATYFQDQVVWITGASSGYGEALARAMVKEGAKLILSARNQAKLEQLAAELSGTVAIPLDLSQFETFDAKMKEALAAHGHIDIVVHNGALAQNAAVMETTLEVERQIMDVDYFSYTELTRLILPHMLAHGTGQIVVVSGLLAQIAAPRRATYAAAKAALIAYFESLRLEMMGKNIDITLLIPGAMQTGLVGKAIQADGTPSDYGDLISVKGVSVEEAARQSLELVSQKRMQAYVGLKDASYELWQLTRSDPEQGVQKLMKMVKGAAT